MIIGIGAVLSDVAKLVALLLPGHQTLAAAYGVGNAVGPRLPLILVPTTAGTGSEVTPISIIRQAKRKDGGGVAGNPTRYRASGSVTNTVCTAACNRRHRH